MCFCRKTWGRRTSAVLRTPIATADFPIFRCLVARRYFSAMPVAAVTVFPINKRKWESQLRTLNCSTCRQRVSRNSHSGVTGNDPTAALYEAQGKQVRRG